MQFKRLISLVALSFGLLGAAHAYDPKATIADLDAKLAKIGAPKIEGTGTVGDQTCLLYTSRCV